MTPYHYAVGGSLESQAPTYVKRQADEDLYKRLKDGEFCYVLNSRQMGKSSLRVRTMQRLQAEGVVCAAIDLMSIGAQQVTLEQWYNGIVLDLSSSLNLTEKVNVRSWLRDHLDLSPVHRLSEFINSIVLTEISQDIVIFIDEIDKVISLNFNVDDFFGLIRFCYNHRADHPNYRRLSFALLGVASPFDLIQDRDRSTFNIGRSIEMTGFKWHETVPLGQGIECKVSRPGTVMSEVLSWTGGQPFLTQKVCQLIQLSDRFIPTGSESRMVAEIVRSCIIENWEAQDEPIHLRNIRERLKKPYLLKVYDRILKEGEIPTKNEREYLELQLSGAVVNKNGKLQVYNRIYAEVFDRDWLAEVYEPDLAENLATPLISLPPILDVSSDVSRDEQIIYDRWLSWVDRESPDILIDRFHKLFILGTDDADREVKTSLERIYELVDCESRFKYILNRCCTILINHWSKRTQRQSIVDLVELFDEKKYPLEIVNSVSPVAQRLQELRRVFTQSEEFEQLKSFAELDKLKEEQFLPENVPLIQLIDRSPYFSKNFLISPNSSSEEERAIRQRRHQYAWGLFYYVSNRKNNQIAPQNPTVLRDEKLEEVLKECIGEVEDSRTYKEVCGRFVNTVNTLLTGSSSYGDFKPHMYQYLISNLKCPYGKNYFSKRLDLQLAKTFPESNTQPLDTILVKQTCHQLFESLVASPTDAENFNRFLNLTGEMGITKTMGVLLKIALLSHGIQPSYRTELEIRFSVLFQYYENKTLDPELKDWLIQLLGNVNVALATNFSKIDISVFQDFL